MIVQQAISELGDQFPAGMRVLAVDDNPTCLMVLQGMLRQCKYKVTATTQATTALKLLRENKNQYDLVISDVHMPDMDGFKLLELVGLEMDLPVIMLSGNDDPKLVMKGVTHGACDYLLKPVRLEALKNIWQHVVRRRKFVDVKNNKRRIDEVEDQDEERQGSGTDNEESSSQKKARLVWTPELHCKFVDAVNQLGADKPVPTKILKLMNVENVTRTHVASHLQKYRGLLKRISEANQQSPPPTAASGSPDLQIVPVNVQSFDTLPMPGFSNAGSGTSCLRMQSFSSLGPVQLARANRLPQTMTTGSYGNWSNVVEPNSLALTDSVGREWNGSSSVNSSYTMDGVMSSLGQWFDPSNSFFCANMDVGSSRQLVHGFVGQQNLQERFLSDVFGPFEDMASAM